VGLLSPCRVWRKQQCLSTRAGRRQVLIIQPWRSRWSQRRASSLVATWTGALARGSQSQENLESNHDRSTGKPDQVRCRARPFSMSHQLQPSVNETAATCTRHRQTPEIHAHTSMDARNHSYTPSLQKLTCSEENSWPSIKPPTRLLPTRHRATFTWPSRTLREDLAACDGRRESTVHKHACRGEQP
jgi:hypothetical protein